MTTTTTATKQPAASPAPPSPPCSLQEDSPTGGPEEPAVEKDKDVLDAFEKQAQLAPNEAVVTHHDFEPISDSQAGWTADAAQRRLELAEKNGTNLIDAWLGPETQTTVKGKAEKPRTSKAENEARKPLSSLSTALLDQNKFMLEVLSWQNQELMRQNTCVVEQLAKQNKATIERLVAPSLPPLTLCVACGAAGQESGGSEKKKSKSLVPNVHLIVRRTSRILAVMLLVVIAVQLGSIRGKVLEESNVRRTGFFGR
jgi:hypothetical protein